MKVIGVSGKICSGKSYFTTILQENNDDYALIIVDQLGHIALEEKTDEIVKTFSSSILEDDGKINREKLGKIVFGSKRELKKLEAIVHPFIKELIIQKLDKFSKEGKSLVLIDAALLNRIKLTDLCDGIIFVRTNLKSRFKRYKKRTNFGFFKFFRVLLNQKDVIINENTNKKPYIIINNNTGSEISYRQILKFCCRILKEESLDE